jgi:hypothetical protein
MLRSQRYGMELPAVECDARHELLDGRAFLEDPILLLAPMDGGQM